MRPPPRLQLFRGFLSLSLCSSSVPVPCLSLSCSLILVFFQRSLSRSFPPPKVDRSVYQRALPSVHVFPMISSFLLVLDLLLGLFAPARPYRFVSFFVVCFGSALFARLFPLNACLRLVSLTDLPPTAVLPGFFGGDFDARTRRGR